MTREVESLGNQSGVKMLAPALNRRFGIHCPLDHGIVSITDGF